MLVQERERLAGLRRAARRFGALDLGGGGVAIRGRGGGERVDNDDVGTPGPSSTANGKSVVVADSRKAPPAAPVTTTTNAVATDGDGGTQVASGSGSGNNSNFPGLP